MATLAQALLGGMEVAGAPGSAAATAVSGRREGLGHTLLSMLLDPAVILGLGGATVAGVFARNARNASRRFAASARTIADRVAKSVPDEVPWDFTPPNFMTGAGDYPGVLATAGVEALLRGQMSELPAPYGDIIRQYVRKRYGFTPALAALLAGGAAGGMAMSEGGNGY